ncbi:hypothetical protein BKA66DRAFT_463609 [Pyrenochaeta sp. MPI-SDFR-AT-0127]|nr:hypothetical protein BKA66DRAFT_463609 [Pyrenochaeta sp. MPI-SDFR-AT-0127]
MLLFNCLHSALRFPLTGAGLHESSKAEKRDSDHTLPKHNHSMSAINGTNMDFSRLLSLPKELRLEIWESVLDNPSMNDLVLRIRRKQFGPSTSSTRFSNSLRRDSHFEVPEIETRFTTSRKSTIQVALLRTSRLVYEEALPILYHSVNFHILHLDSIFPLFLRNLSSFAQSHIRHVSLSTNNAFRCDGSSMYWALTCAQIAKLSDSLHQIDIEGEWPLSRTNRKNRSILYPLLKIKAPKKFVPVAHDSEFQQLLAKAAKEKEDIALVRRASTAADAAARAAQEDSKRVRPGNAAQRARWGESSPKRQMLQEIVPRTKPSPVTHSTGVEDHVAHDSSSISDIRQFEQNPEEWDMVSERSYSPELKKRTSSTWSDDEHWTDVASTIVAKDEDDKESEDWELIH